MKRNRKSGKNKQTQQLRTSNKDVMPGYAKNRIGA